MKRDRDKEVIQIFLDCYNTVAKDDFRVRSYPDEENRKAKSVDVLCENSKRKTLAIEHTRIEGFPGEMADTARFEEVMGQYDKDPALARPGFQTSASIPVGCITTGINWKSLGRDIGVFLNKCVPLGGGTYAFTQGPVSIPITITTLEIPSSPGSFLVDRNWPGQSNEATIEKCFSEKLPKLKTAAADFKILLLEQPGIAGSVSMDLVRHGKKNGPPDWLPNEIWLLHTAALQTERFVYASEQYPLLNYRKADWKNGIVTVRTLAA